MYTAIFKKYTALLSVVLMFLLSVTVNAQQSRHDQQAELRRLRQEIERYRTDLAEKENQETSLLEMLAGLDREIDLTRGLLLSLRKEDREKRVNITQIEKELARTEKELKYNKESFKKRLRHFYKYGRAKEIEFILTARSINQAHVLYKFMRLIAETDRRKIKTIITEKNHIEQQQTLLKTELAAQERILQETETESANLENSREERSHLLEQIRQDKNSLQRRLLEYREAARRIEDFIFQQEQNRLAEKEGTRKLVTGDFDKLRGKVPWPVRGRIISTYGKHEHPQLGTITQNIGIDITAAEGTPVRCVADGTVSVITWQRGGGNIIIIDHGGGYYTVYSHMAEIYVEKNDPVSYDRVIGSVGDSGSLNGPVLHFEVWQGTKHMNPLQWLERTS